MTQSSSLEGRNPRFKVSVKPGLPQAAQAAERGAVPASRVAQGVVTSIIACLYAFIPSVSSAYWIFEVMTTQVYLIVYVLMFMTAVKLRRDQPDHPRGYRVPALTLLCVVGFLSTIVAFFIGFVPPSQFGSGNTLVYIVLIAGGVGIVGPGIPLLLYALRKPHWKTAEATTGT